MKIFALLVNENFIRNENTLSKEGRTKLSHFDEIEKYIARKKEKNQKGSRSEQKDSSILQSWQHGFEKNVASSIHDCNLSKTILHAV